jgi:hypothetical protein
MQYHVEEMKAVLFKTINTIIHLQKRVKHTLMEPSRLNLGVTDEEQLVGVRFCNVEGDVHQPPVSSFLSFAQYSHLLKFTCLA